MLAFIVDCPVAKLIGYACIWVGDFSSFKRAEKTTQGKLQNIETNEP